MLELACREAVFLFHVTAEQSAALLATAVASSSRASAIAPPPLLSYLLSSHNDVSGYDWFDDLRSLVLTRDACEGLLALVDDDKRSGVNQQLLTDMFSRMSVHR